MSRVLRGLAVVALGVAGTLVAPSAGAASGSLAGVWTSTDTDGSTQTLNISGAGTPVYAMVYVDDAATGACGGAPARVVGPGHVDGDEVTMAGTLTCVPGGNVFRSRITLTFTHDTSDDTLTDGFGTTWYRVS